MPVAADFSTLHLSIKVSPKIGNRTGIFSEAVECTVCHIYMKLPSSGMLGAVGFWYRYPFQDNGSVPYTHLRTFLCMHITLTNDAEFTDINLRHKRILCNLLNFYWLTTRQWIFPCFGNQSNYSHCVLLCGYAWAYVCLLLCCTLPLSCFTSKYV